VGGLFLFFCFSFSSDCQSVQDWLTACFTLVSPW
jgi:hypothetical protein